MSTQEYEAKQRDWESLILPLVLMITGLLVLFGADTGLLSLDRIQNLWPAAIILVGLAELLPSSKKVEHD
jgi:hypothetical protein